MHTFSVILQRKLEMTQIHTHILTRKDSQTYKLTHTHQSTSIHTHQSSHLYTHTHTHKHTLWRCAVDRKRETWLERQDLRGGERVGVKMCAFDYRERERESKREKEGEDREIYRA